MATKRFRYGYLPYRGPNTTIENDTTTGGQIKGSRVVPAGRLVVIEARFELPSGFRPITRQQALKYFGQDWVKEQREHLTPHDFPEHRLKLKPRHRRTMRDTGFKRRRGFR